jgi:hypothetical protein
LCTDVFSGRQLLESLSKECRLLGFLRLLSTRDSLRLPFQRTSIHRYLRFSRGVFNLDIAAYARALLSNAGLSLRLLAGILSAANLPPRPRCSRRSLAFNFPTGPRRELPGPQ